MSPLNLNRSSPPSHMTPNDGTPPPSPKQLQQPPPPRVPVWKHFLRPSPNPAFTTSLTLLCAVAAAITTANLYYTHPILNLAAASFNVSYARASLIPQLLQAGYGLGILLLCPLGDIVRLRPLLLILTTITTLTWLGLCLTPNFHLFAGLSFIAGFTTVGPQILIPLIGTLAPPDKQATAVSVVLAGMLMGIAVPRVVAGVLTGYMGGGGSWRNIYWFVLGLQTVLLVAMWVLFPDFAVRGTGRGASQGGIELPDSQKGEKRKGKVAEFGTRYVEIARDIARMVVTEPVLAYGCVVAFLINAAQASFWTTLTAHLAGPPFGFGPLQVGLFSIVAVVTTMLIPVYGWAVVERFETWFASVVGMGVGIVLMAVDTFATTRIGVAGPLLQAVGLDLGLQAGSVAYRAAVYRKLLANRANVVFTGSAFIGQLVGTSVGNTVYARRGWMVLGIVHLAFAVLSMGVVLLRGPAETRWAGWKGGPTLWLQRETRSGSGNDSQTVLC